MAVIGKVGAVYVSDVDAAPAPFADKPTTADAERKRYQVTDPACRYWPEDATIVVKKNGEPISAGFTLERAGGLVVFEAAQQAEDAIQVSGSALEMVQAGGFFIWSVDTDADDLEATTFGSQGRKEFIRGLTEWNGSAEAYWGDQKFFSGLGEVVAVRLFVDAGVSQRCLEGFALVNSVGIEANVDELVSESIEFTGVGPLYSRL